MTRFVASIEARMGSSRLPGKMMMLLGGNPTLAHLVYRIQKSKLLSDIVIATTESPADDAIADWAASNGVRCFRGNEDDVLDRVLQAQKSAQADIVVELCGDTPFLDPVVVDAAITAWNDHDVDLVTTARNRSYPDGQDVEVFALSALEKIATERNEPDVREHVSLPFYEEDIFRVHDLIAPNAHQRPDLRLVLDTANDARFLGALASACMVTHDMTFTLDELLSVIDGSPELQALHAETLEAAA